MSEKSGSQQGLVQMVTPIHTMNEQMGAHLLAALQRPGTVGVITTMMPGVGAEQLVSIPLNPHQLVAIQQVLRQTMVPEELDEPARRVIGFHAEE